MRIALRTLARELRFSTFVVLVLAVGIGATTTVFTVINQVLLRAMPFKNPDRLVWIWSTRTDRDKAIFSIPNFLDTREQVQTLSDLAAFANWSANLTGGSEAERLQGVRVTGNAFAMLGGKAAAGRLIGRSDAAPGADRAVVVSFGVWQRRFGQRTDALGSKILLNGDAYTLAGVLPADFVLPGAEVDIVGALDLENDPRRAERGSTDFIVAGRAPAKLEDTPAAQTRWISSNYFAALGFPIQKGRSFKKFDVQNSEPVLIIDSALASRFMNGLNPLEQSVSVDFGDRRPARTLKVVGVVGDVKHFALDDPPTPTLYFPIDQVQSAHLPVLTAGLNLVIKTAGDPMSMADDVRRAVSSIDPNVAASAPATVYQLLRAAVAPRRFTATVFEVFAAAGLILAVIGLYAVLSYAVVRRKYEIGLRVAFGAKRRQIIALILRDGMKVTFLGCVFGLCALAAVGPAIEPLLFDTDILDTGTYVSMLVLLFIVSALASYVPARRAAAVDPMVALRTE